MKKKERDRELGKATTNRHTWRAAHAEWSNINKLISANKIAHYLKQSNSQVHLKTRYFRDMKDP